MTVSTSRRVFIFDSARLRSHLFFWYMSTHAAFQPIYHPFVMAAMFGPEHIAQYLKHSQMRQDEIDTHRSMPGMDATFESDGKQFIKNIEEADKTGKIVLANEHWYNILDRDLVIKIIRGEVTEPSSFGENPTILSLDLLNTIAPIILIRHPALSVNSIYRSALAMSKQRPGDEDFDFLTMNKPLRMLFDWFKSQGKQPIVVDAEDLLWRTNEMSKNLCARLGISPEGLRDQWDPTPKEKLDKMNPIAVMLTQDIQASTGIIRPEQKVRSAVELDIDVADFNSAR
jgi:hypothetical protein